MTANGNIENQVEFLIKRRLGVQTLEPRIAEIP